MINEFGAKELYEVSLKTTDNIVINNQYEPDEVFMFFNKVQISNISGFWANCFCKGKIILLKLSGTILMN